MPVLRAGAEGTVVPTMNLSAVRQFFARKRTIPAGVANAQPIFALSKKFDKKLWYGYSGRAVPELELVAHGPQSESLRRAAASWSLARWYAYTGSFEKVISHLALLRSAAPDLAESRRAVILELDALTKQEQFATAQKRVSYSLHRLKRNSDFSLACSNLLGLGAFPDSAGGSTAADRLAWLNASFSAAGLARIESRRPDLPLSLGNLTTDALPLHAAETSAPLVSVIVPAFNASQTLPWSLQSIISQTWQNIEVIVVDDASTDDTWPIIEAFRERDPRVVGVQHRANSGTYAAQNSGLRVARGAFITTHGADDWSHPEKIRIQVGPAIRSNNICTATSGVRVTEHLIAALRPHPVSYIFWNVSSLLYPAAHLARLGGWDEVRMGADSELYHRVRTHFSSEALSLMPDVPLTFALDRPEGLMRADATGWLSTRFGARREYRESYEYWHATGLSGAEIDLCSARKPFPAPAILLRSGTRDCTVDTLVVSDFSVPGELASLNQKVLSAASARSAAVGLCHWPAPDRSHCRLDSQIRAFLYEKNLACTVPGEKVTCRSVFVTSANILRNIPDRIAAIETEYAAILIREGDCPEDEHDLADHLTIFLRASLLCFNTEANFAPASALVRERLSRTRFEIASAPDYLAE